ncbi:SRPBCC domain-containing protein [Thermaerobacter sp. PB12/4term]|uniref:SRPBCC family protein n=1 Tax=Thermaerobacter sp. PB12/4term TaxID=2293838 RepID=UPI00193F30F0|nr:SRPBCC domain-containing protein [Thermaerobacter sp. PB12/4term]
MDETRAVPLPPIRHSIAVQAPVERVWQAVATAEGLSAWLMPNDLKAEAGHPFTLQTPFGPVPCRVTVVEPPHRLAFRWGGDWEVTLELEPQEGEHPRHPDP